MSELRFDWPVPMAHPAFAGHFPGQPILPGVVLLDRVIFLAQAQMDAEVGGGAVNGVSTGWTVSQTKFLSPVAPGDRLTFVLTPDTRGGWRFGVQAADGRAVASGNLVAQKT